MCILRRCTAFFSNIFLIFSKILNMNVKNHDYYGCIIFVIIALKYMNVGRFKSIEDKCFSEIYPY